MNRKSWVLVVSVATLLAGSAYAATPHNGGAKPKDEKVAFLKHAHEVVAATLLDPTSARFAHEMLVRGEDGKLQYVCGTVQGKNTYGGYAQPALFAAEPGTGQVFVVHNVLTTEDLTGTTYKAGMDWLSGICGKDAKGAKEEAPVLPDKSTG
jgi:hypothetical protein